MAQILKKVFSKYLVLTNTLTCGCLLGTGDLVAQNIEQRFMDRKKEGCKGVQIDWKRTGKSKYRYSHDVYVRTRIKISNFSAESPLSGVMVSLLAQSAVHYGFDPKSSKNQLTIKLVFAIFKYAALRSWAKNWLTQSVYCVLVELYIYLWTFNVISYL